MNGNRTFTMIKPLTVQQGHTGKILDRILEEGFRITALKMVRMNREEAEAFYRIHQGKPFFTTLVDYMTSGPVVAAILEKENAVTAYRDLIGATDPAKAAAGTIRNLFATDLTRNAVHGSESDENALVESKFFFSSLEEIRLPKE